MSLEWQRAEGWTSTERRLVPEGALYRRLPDGQLVALSSFADSDGRSFWCVSLYAGSNGPYPPDGLVESGNIFSTEEQARAAADAWIEKTYPLAALAHLGKEST